MNEGQPLDGSLFGEDQPCFGCSPGHPSGFRLAFQRDDAAVTTRFVPLETHQGPLGVMHGGLVLTLADELAVWTVIGLRGKFGFTGDVQARLKRPVRIGREVTGRGTILEGNARVARVSVELIQEENTVFDATFGVAVLDARAAERLVGQPLPPAWARFAR